MKLAVLALALCVALPVLFLLAAIVGVVSALAARARASSSKTTSPPSEGPYRTPQEPKPILRCLSCGGTREEHEDGDGYFEWVLPGELRSNVPPRPVGPRRSLE